MSEKKEKKSRLVAYILIAAIAIILLLLTLAIFGGKKTDDIRISGGEKTIGLKCSDSESLHPALRDRTPITHSNTIIANFADDALSTITLYYVGTYDSPSEAKQAEAYAQADYGLILAKEYGVNVDSFEHSFTIDGEKVSMTITAKDNSVNDKTAPYFLLERSKTFPKNLNGMKQRYEEKNFSCEIIK